jgi:hypothetical protein
MELFLITHTCISIYLSIYLSICLSVTLKLLLDFGCFQFINLLTGRTPLTGDQPVARPLPAHRTVQTQNRRTQTSMPQVVFEPTILVFERPKAVRALDRAASVIGTHVYTSRKYIASSDPSCQAYIWCIVPMSKIIIFRSFELRV